MGASPTGFSIRVCNKMLCVQCNLVEIPRGSTKYCSRACMALGYTKQKPKCVVCGQKAYSTISKFCSRRCSATFHNRARQKFRNCLACLKPHKNTLYCSYKCSANSRSNRWDHLSADVRKEKDRVDNLAAVRRYQARRYSQTPIDADQYQIREIYGHCPDGHEVDHVIPISKGGLHHQHNLQYLLMLDNRRKSNKIIDG